MYKNNLFFLIFLSIFVLLTRFCVEAKEAKARYISLAPSTTEILFALGLDNEIVGVSNFCDYPAEARLKNKVGDFSHPVLEKIILLNPDYIFCTGLEQSMVVHQLRQLNFKVYVSDPSSIEDLFSSIIEIGKITGRSKQAQLLLEEMRTRLQKIRNRYCHIPVSQRPKIYLEVWPDPLTTIGSLSFIDDLISLAGGVNIANDVSRAYFVISPEQVIKSNPNFIVITHSKNKNALSENFRVKRNLIEVIFKKRFGWDNILAIKRQNIISEIDEDLLLRPGPRAILGLEKLHRLIYNHLYQ